MSIPIINLGEKFAAGNDAIDAGFVFLNMLYSYSDNPTTDTMAAGGAALSLFSYAATRFLPDNNAASGYFSMLGRAAGVLQLTSEAINLDNAIKGGNVDQQVQAGLGMIAGLGGVISNIPLPATRALGIGMQALGTIGKEGIKNGWFHDCEMMWNGLKDDLEEMWNRLSKDLERQWGQFSDDLENSILNGVRDLSKFLKDLSEDVSYGLQDGLNGLEKYCDQLAKDMEKSILDGTIGLSRDLEKFWNQARQWFTRRDPLTLDLDSDGLETVGINTAILFDHGGTGIKTASGWLKPDDASLTATATALSTPVANCSAMRP